MQKLSLPNVKSNELFEECVNSIVRSVLMAAGLRGKYSKLKIEEDKYIESAHNADFTNLMAVPAKEDPNIFGYLRKGHLQKLYTYYMVDKSKPARKFYDEILASANDICPFCGGIGVPRTLDHYLPKANYPLYSIFPPNLIPCCRDCNSAKGNSVAKVVGEQILHPYFEKPHFYNDVWVSATIDKYSTPVIRYQVSPPEYWSNTDQQRVKAHFKKHDLAQRFTIEAAANITELIHMRKCYFKDYCPEQFKKFLLEYVNCSSLLLNGWKRTMYRALSDSEWFLSAEF